MPISLGYVERKEKHWERHRKDRKMWTKKMTESRKEGSGWEQTNKKRWGGGGGGTKMKLKGGADEQMKRSQTNLMSIDCTFGYRGFDLCRRHSVC